MSIQTFLYFLFVAACGKVILVIGEVFATIILVVRSCRKPTFSVEY